MQLHQLKDTKGKNDLPNLTQIKLADDSLSPVAEAGDSVVVAQYLSPKDNDLVAYQYNDKYFVRWWRLAETEIVATDAEGNEETLSPTELLIIGVVVEVRHQRLRRPSHWPQLDAEIAGLVSAILAPFLLP